jgi:hypothetical protein
MWCSQVVPSTRWFTHPIVHPPYWPQSQYVLKSLRRLIELNLRRPARISEFLVVYTSEPGKYTINHPSDGSKNSTIKKRCNTLTSCGILIETAWHCAGKKIFDNEATCVTTVCVNSCIAWLLALVDNNRRAPGASSLNLQYNLGFRAEQRLSAAIRWLLSSRCMLGD